MRNTVTINGQRVPYWDSDPARTTEPPILFLHGWALSPWAYQDMLNAMSRQHRVVAPFLPSLTWNRSQTRIKSHHDWAALIALMCQQLGLSTVHAVGQSTGGGVAGCLAAAQPNLVKSLTLIDASGAPSHVPRAMAITSPYEIGVQLINPWYVRPQMQMASSFLLNLIQARGQLIDAARLPLTEDLTATYQRITAPTNVMWGGKAMLFPVAAGRQIQELIPGATLHVVPHGLHNWEINNSDLAAQQVVGFIAKQSAQEL
jgi:pimeloyl-ACP methyl ester carboxylesterase